ncbi:E3 ubiquitin-protein ligase MARCHF5 [Drosophila madeirensis]|uniref:E3 ubiquitin-protein ligase MARCHF5 n=1 Tax=Drosophila madeirensis TaxID=30013 RepID=A0AAU9FZW0_DROMD
MDPRLDWELEEERICWICLTGDEEQPPQRIDWLHPCRCRGSTKWVHRVCLNRWIDAQQLEQPNQPIVCTQCRTQYIMVLPSLNAFDRTLQGLYRFYNSVCHSMLACTLSSVVYLSAGAYGAVTMIQILGFRVAMTLIKAEPVVLVVVLPTIPTVLVLLRDFQWDMHLIRLWRSLRTARPAGLAEDSHMLPGAPLDDNYYAAMPLLDNPEMETLHEENFLGLEGIANATESFVVALSLPSIATLLGRTLYAKVDNKLLGTVLGGLTFLGTKALARAYMRHCNRQCLRGRRVLDSVPLNVQRYNSLRESGSRNIPNTQ